MISILQFCTEGGARTHTFQGTLDFESSASTNFTTSAYIYKSNLLLNQLHLAGIKDSAIIGEVTENQNTKLIIK